MNRPATKWIALSALGMGLIGLGSWHAGASAVPTEAVRTVQSNVAVVNLDQIFRPELDEFTERIGRFETQLKEWDGQIEELNNQIQAIRDDLETLDLTEPQQVQLAAELLEKEATRNARREIAQRRAVAQEGQIYRVIYRHAREVIADIAREEGYDLVVFNDMRTPDIGNINMVLPQEVKAAIRSQNILFAADGIDITNALVVRMNNDYAAGRWSE